MRFLISFFILTTIISCTKFGKNVTVKGRVMNPVTGAGIEGAEVKLLKVVGGYDSNYKTIKSVTTDASGAFELDKYTWTKPVARCEVGDLYKLGWTKDGGQTFIDNFELEVKKGKVITADFYVLPYGELKISIHNINCQGPNDTLIYKRNYVSLSGISVFQPFTLMGCYDNDGAFAKVPSGDYLVEWTVIRNGISNSYSHLVTVPGNGQAVYSIDY